ncbi:MAG: DNA translocase FtsK [Candidatus Andersenbacteria bacterium]
MRFNPFRKSSGRGKESFLRPETKQAIIGILLILFSLILALSFFAAAGPTGSLLLVGVRKILGILAFVTPVALIWLGVYLIRPRQERVPRLRIVGVGLALVGLLGLFHLIGTPVEDAYQTALEGRGGGLLGFLFSFPLSKAFSPIAAILLFIAAFLTGIFLTFDLSPSSVWMWLRTFIPSREEIQDEEVADDSVEDLDEEGSASAVPTFRISRMRKGADKTDPNQLKLQEQQAQREEEQREKERAQLRSANKKYRPPSIDILHSSIGKPDSGNVDANKKKIQTTLEKFGIAVTMGKVSVGPTVAQYTLRPEEGVKLARITGLQNDLALALAAHPIRIEAPIPGTNFVGIEIPNKDVSLVRLRDIITSKDFRQSQSPLAIAMGKDVSGMPKAAGIDKMPHLLVAGATGSGKSIFINTLILSLLYRNSPALVRMILVDPKRVELSLFNGIPHLLTPVITEPDKTINALKWAVKEMDRRYRLLSEVGSRNLLSYNSNHPENALPFIVIVIDELADLMSTHARDVEGMIVRLSQMARAIGIHLVLATQRPSVNVITGLIKANIPTRIAFNVASQVDSRTILDGAGAEKLLGSGDMLYLPGDQAKPVRLQGGFVSEEEVRQVVQDIQENNDLEIEHDDSIVTPQRDFGGSGGGETVNDDMYEDAKQVVMQSGKASASLLQRRLRVGYARAARLIDMLEENGVISTAEGNKPREILVSVEDEYGKVEEEYDDSDDEEADDSEYDLDDDDDDEDAEDEDKRQQW